jgi:peroxiredoxin Q/BCP
MTTMRLLLHHPIAGLGAAVLALACVGLTAAQDESAKVEVGKPAPAFDLPATQINKALPDKKDAKTISLKDFENKKNVVLFFFPKATIECCGYRDRAEQFAQLDTVLLGISVDPLDAQVQFTEKEKLTYPLLADTDKKTAKAYGVLSPRGFANRATFVIDKKGIVRQVYPNANATKNAEEVLTWVKENLKDK